ncbi:MAG: glycogen synthase, partial [Spirochaetaceae bacterium]
MPRRLKSNKTSKTAKISGQETMPLNQAQALVEVSWEVCNQVGGIYTVIRSKVPAVTEKWKNGYCLFGPFVPEHAMGEFEEIQDKDNPFAIAADSLAKDGFEVHFGRWLVTGNPQVVLVNPKSVQSKLHDWKYFLWDHYKISIPDSDDLANQAFAFGMLSYLFLKSLTQAGGENLTVTAHFHEWMAGAGIPELRREKVPVSMVFTTHATLLGRYLATNNFNFYEHLSFFDWLSESQKYGIEARVRLERAAA